MNGCVYKTASGQCQKYSDKYRNTLAWCCGDNIICKDRKLSNADRIRNMEDDELAIWLCESIKVCSECFAEEFCKPTGEQANGMLEWLKQEAT